MSLLYSGIPIYVRIDTNSYRNYKMNENALKIRKALEYALLIMLVKNSCSLVGAPSPDVDVNAKALLKELKKRG